MKTNTTVYLSLEVWDSDSRILNKDDEIRDIDNLVIPFSVITASNVWTVKRFTLSDGAYLEIKFKIETCDGNFGGLGCSFCIDNYYTSSCDKYCQPVHGNYTCNTSGNKICADHRTGEKCEKCSEGWGGNKCQECAQDYYPEGICNVKCTEEENNFTCKEDGSKACYQNWRGEECENCSEGYFNEFCDVFCEKTPNYNCSSTGVMVCFDQTTTVENNCQTLSKLSKKSKTIIGAVSGITFFAFILIVGIVLMRKKHKKSHTSQLVEKTDAKRAKPEKPTGASKSGQSSTDLNTSSKGMTYATLNHKSRDWNIAFTEADTTYATLNRELEHSIEDNNEQSNYTNLGVEKTRQTHIKKGEENVNQGVPQTENFKEEDTYADISIVVKKLGPNIESEKKVEQLASHGLDPSSENYEDTYSHPTKSYSSIKDCCQEELQKKETYADHVIILGPKEKDEAAEDNEEECMYADVSFVAKRKEFGKQEDRMNEKEGSAIYLTMRDTRDEHTK